MASTSIGQQLKALLEQQKREYEKTRLRYDQRKQWQQQMLRLQHRMDRELVGQYTKKGRTAQDVVQLMRVSGAIHNLPRALQQQMERIAQRGGMSHDIVAMQRNRQRETQLRQEEKLERKKLQLYQDHQSQQEKHRQAASKEKEDEDRREKRRAMMKHAGMSFLGGNFSGGFGALGAGLGGPVGIALRLAAAGYGVATGAAHATTGIGNVVQNASLTSGQKFEALHDKINPLGAAIRDMILMFEGVTERIRQMGLQAEVSSLKIKQSGELESIRASMQFTQRRSLYRVNPLLRASEAIDKAGAPLARMDRTTFQGERAYQFARVRYGAKVGVERAEAEERAARRSHTEAKAYADNSRAVYQKSVEGFQQALRRRNALRSQDTPEQRILHPERKEQREAAEKSADVAFLNMLNKEHLMRQAINREQEAGLTLAEKQGIAEKDRLNQLKAEIDILRMKEQNISHGAAAVGRMTDAERAQFGTAMKLLDQGVPLNRMPAHLRGLLEHAAPEAIHRRYEQAGLGTRHFKEAQRRGLLDQGDLNKIRQEITTKEVQFEVKVTLNEARVADAVARKLGKALEDMVKTITMRQKEEIENLKRGQQIRNAQPGG